MVIRAKETGNKDQRVEIHADTGSSEDGVGQHQITDSLVGTYWAEVQGQGGKDLYRAQQHQALATHVVIMRADSTTRAIQPLTHWFIWRSRRLNVVSCQQEGYRDLDIMFTCEEQVSGD